MVPGNTWPCAGRVRVQRHAQGVAEAGVGEAKWGLAWGWTTVVPTASLKACYAGNTAPGWGGTWPLKANGLGVVELGCTLRALAGARHRSIGGRPAHVHSAAPPRRARAHAALPGGLGENDMQMGGRAPASDSTADGTANTPAPTSRPLPTMLESASAPEGLAHVQKWTTRDPSQKLSALLAPAAVGERVGGGDERRCRNLQLSQRPRAQRRRAEKAARQQPGGAARAPR